jgi:hypothetical protein
MADFPILKADAKGGADLATICHQPGLCGNRFGLACGQQFIAQPQTSAARLGKGKQA